MNKSIQNLLEHGDLAGITTYQAGIMQSNVDRLLQKHCDDLLRPYGITKIQWLIIGATHDAGEAGLRITDLAAQLGMTLAFLTNTINVMELKHILVRVHNEQDSRSKLVRVHAGFEQSFMDIELGLRNGLRKSIYAHVDMADFRIYMKVLYQLANVNKPSK